MYSRDTGSGNSREGGGHRARGARHHVFEQPAVLHRVLQALERRLRADELGGDQHRRDVRVLAQPPEQRLPRALLLRRRHVLLPSRRVLLRRPRLVLSVRAAAVPRLLAAAARRTVCAVGGRKALAPALAFALAPALAPPRTSWPPPPLTLGALPRGEAARGLAARGGRTAVGRLGGRGARGAVATVQLLPQPQQRRGVQPRLGARRRSARALEVLHQEHRRAARRHLRGEHPCRARQVTRGAQQEPKPPLRVQGRRRGSRQGRREGSAPAWVRMPKSEGAARASATSVSKRP